ncbi:MAG: aldo/keto reductase [Halobacteriaceae archaeon]
MPESIPRLGIGTWQNTDPDACANAVATALEMGYRHVDTAQAYHNEEYVGEGLARADVDREDIFVATKLHPRTTGLGHDDVIEGAETSLDRLGLDHIDLLYVHWPTGDYDPEETLSAYDELVERGLIDHVGLSNFTPDLLDEAKDHLDAPVFAHQVEMHPLFQQDELHEYAREDDHWLVAYSPLARGEVFDVPEVQQVADKHGVSAAQVSLAWLLEKETVAAIPKATSEEHIRDNYAALNLELDEQDVRRLDAIQREERLVEIDGAPWL